MKVKVNGIDRSVNLATPKLDEVLQKLEFDVRYSVVAVNRQCVPKSQHNNCTVKDGDEIEVLTAQQGG